jgi:hypothetical protein
LSASLDARRISLGSSLEDLDLALDVGSLLAGVVAHAELVADREGGDLGSEVFFGVPDAAETIDQVPVPSGVVATLLAASWAKQSAGKQFCGPEKRQFAGIEQRKTLPLPNSGSPTHAPIEFEQRFPSDEKVAGGSIFIEEDHFGVVGRWANYPGSMCDAGTIRGGYVDAQSVRFFVDLPPHGPGPALATMGRNRHSPKT